ncbi:MAG: hypothetical protein IJI80_00255 [Methanobrevibacter sp.]|uniref:hypothetical protein n=1 Tax=Methanobrevibacter sp. TaxID=66852 RepID=UPI0025D6AE3F|nr:hypothetical protein [Methanobrevibacter sp.]MBQ6138093.1 hypothetical protein [Methanobrevibacter sp.]
MDFVKGIVKKYFRSYNRTLKDGTKKTYKTEQVQVTVSKSDNIFEDKEEVFIISADQAEEFNEFDELKSALELFNSMLLEDNKKLTKDFTIADEDLKTTSSKLKALSEKLVKREEQLEESRKRLLVLKEDCSGLKEQLEENQNTISSLRKQLEDKNFIISDLNDDLDLLNEKLNSQNDDVIIDSEFLSNEQFTSSSNSYSFDDYVELQKEYIALLKKYEKSQEDLYNEKVKVIHYRNLLDKFKNFILRIQ